METSRSGTVLSIAAIAHENLDFRLREEGEIVVLEGSGVSKRFWPWPPSVVSPGLK